MPISYYALYEADNTAKLPEICKCHDRTKLPTDFGLK